MVVNWNKQIRSETWGEETNDADCKGDQVKTQLTMAWQTGNNVEADKNQGKHSNKHKYIARVMKTLVQPLTYGCNAQIFKKDEEKCFQGGCRYNAECKCCRVYFAEW